MIAKLGAYGFSWHAIQYIKNSLKNRQQRVRVNSNWGNIITGIPQGS